MKKIDVVIAAGFTVCGVLAVRKAFLLAEAGATLLLMHFGGYGYGAAAARAPLYVGAVLCTLAGIGVSLYSLHAENQRYKRAAQRQKIHQPPKNTVKSGRKAG